MVRKRSYSATSEHVKKTTVEDRHLLKCYREDDVEVEGSRAPETPYIWFHQEYIEALESLGEFRVCIY
jgi:hypothetical protein